MEFKPRKWLSSVQTAKFPTWLMSEYFSRSFIVPFHLFIHINKTKMRSNLTDVFVIQSCIYENEDDQLTLNLLRDVIRPIALVIHYQFSPAGWLPGSLAGFGWLSRQLIQGRQAAPVKPCDCFNCSINHWCTVPVTVPWWNDTTFSSITLYKVFVFLTLCSVRLLHHSMIGQTIFVIYIELRAALKTNNQIWIHFNSIVHPREI